MIVAIHQPHFFPWLGYLHRMRQADIFVCLDHVQFEPQNYQNRVCIKTGQGPMWLKVPVRQAQAQRLVDTLVDNSRGGRQRWGRKVFLSLRYAYAGCPFFHGYEAALERLLSASWERLVDLDRASTDFLREAFDIRTPMVRSSDLPVAGHKSELVLDICRCVGADAFLCGLGGCRRYLDYEAFAKAGVRVLCQQFAHPRYDQHPHPAQFVAGLSALDLLFNCGPAAKDLLGGGSRAEAPGRPAAPVSAAPA